MTRCSADDAEAELAAALRRALSAWLQGRYAFIGVSQTSSQNWTVSSSWQQVTVQFNSGRCSWGFR